MKVTIRGLGEVEIQAGESVASEVLGSLKDAKYVVACRINGMLKDLSTVLSAGDEVELVRSDSDDGREVLRHSTAHVLAQAVTRLWRGAKYAIGPAIENGFYYDFDIPAGKHLAEDDLKDIEAEMRKIIAEKQDFTRQQYSFERGLKVFAEQPYKVEIIESVKDSVSGYSGQDESEGVSLEEITAYMNSPDFVDLCRGPHVPNTSYLGHFRLMRVAGAYWRGDEHRPQLQRVYGTAWESDAALQKHLDFLDEAERRDHRKLGLDLDLFHFPPEIGSGLPVFHPKGALIRYLMEEFSRREHLNAGYEFAWTPHITKSSLLEISGHLGWYKDGMFPPMEMEGSSYYLKPMNCPMHILIYKSRARSYRELPLRLFEFGTVYRYERSGVLHGLARVRGLTQDDSHIFCSKEQLPGEIERLLRFVLALLNAFGLADFEAEIATRPEKSIGEDEDWDIATRALIEALDKTGLPYRIAEGEGAFYAPKIDVHLTDAIGRRWQVSTLQVDLQLPQRFDMQFTNQDNRVERPYMVHRALFGSVERFFAILLEHFGGSLPTWLSPTQARILPVSEPAAIYGEEVLRQLIGAGFRAELDAAREPLGARIRKAKMEKLPYILVVGERDQEHRTVGVNRRGAATPDRDVSLDEFIASTCEEIRPPKLEGMK